MIGTEWKKEITSRTQKAKPNQDNEHKDRFVKSYASKVKAKKKVTKKKPRAARTIKKTSLSPGHRFGYKEGPKPIRL